jgi:hypothetical protein
MPELNIIQGQPLLDRGIVSSPFTRLFMCSLEIGDNLSFHLVKTWKVLQEGVILHDATDRAIELIRSLPALAASIANCDCAAERLLR